MGKIQIEGLGTYEVDDSFFDAPPEVQNATLEEIKASAGPSVPPRPAEPKPRAQVPPDLSHDGVFQSLIHQESGGRAGVVGPMTPWGRAQGMTQLLPDTAAEMARKLGMPWRPEMLTATSPEAVDYQTRLGRAYFDEGMEKTGNTRDALRYYHAGPDRKLWGPKTDAYADAVLARAAGDGSPINAAQAMFDKGASGEEISTFLKQNQISANPADLAKALAYRDKGGKGAKIAAPPEQPQDSLTDAAALAGTGVRKGIVGTLDLPTNLAEYLLTVPGSDEPLVDLPNVGTWANEQLDAIIQPRTSKSALGRYAEAIGEGVGGSVIPGMGVRSLGLAALSGAGAGAGAQAGADIAPEGDVGGVTSMVGGLAGGIAAGGVPAGRRYGLNKLVEKTIEDKRGVHLAEAVKRMETKAKDVDPNGVVPRGRGPLSVQQINATGTQYLKELEGRLGQMGLPKARAEELRTAIKRKDGITSDEIAALEADGSVEGQAVAEAIRSYQATTALTPPFGGDKRGPLAKVYNGALDLIPMPAVLNKMLKFKPGDVNQSRIDAAQRALKKVKAYDKVLDKTGPAPTKKAIDTFREKYESITASQEAEKQARTSAKSATTAARAKAKLADPEWRGVDRQKQWDEAKARFQRDFDSKMSSPNEDLSVEILDGSNDGIKHIRDNERTVESAMRYFDTTVAPKLEADGFNANEIRDLRHHVQTAKEAGTRYVTDAEFEQRTKVRPSKQPSPVSSPIPKDPPKPSAPDENLSNVGQAGGAIVNNMYDMLWSKLQKGELTEAGRPSRFLQEAHKAGVKSRDELAAFAQTYVPF